MRKGMTSAAVIGCVVMMCASDTPTAAPKPVNPTATFRFHDRSNDRIRSDNGSPYVNGVGGVEGQIYATGSGDATLNLYRTRNPKRVFIGEYGSAPPPSPPDGEFSDGWFINIHNVWSVPNDGVEYSTLASFTTGVGDFRWCGDGDITEKPGWCRLEGSQWVKVTRTGDSWYVVADSPDNMPNLLFRTIRGKGVILGRYDMPFALTIETP